MGFCLWSLLLLRSTDEPHGPGWQGPHNDSCIEECGSTNGSCGHRGSFELPTPLYIISIIHIVVLLCIELFLVLFIRLNWPLLSQLLHSTRKKRHVLTRRYRSHFGSSWRACRLHTSHRNKPWIGPNCGPAPLIGLAVRVQRNLPSQRLRVPIAEFQLKKQKSPSRRRLHRCSLTRVALAAAW